jgi:glucose/arabinose dehydrogenase
MKYFRIFLIASLGAASFGACVPRQATSTSVALTLTAEGLASPVALVEAGDGSGRLFVADQTGLIWILRDGRRLDQPFLDLRERLVRLNDFYDERGLLGLAFHPGFPRDPRFYVYYSAPLEEGLSPDEWDHTTHVSEFRVWADDLDRANPASERIILSIDKPGYNFEAGGLAFGHEGDLYIATGDSVRDPASQTGLYAQDTASLLGKILRIDVDGTGDGRAYRIPPDNPFANGGGRPEIYAYGFRNPYRFSFDGLALYVGDVGQAVMEEADLVRLGGNYGWPIREGTTCFNPNDWTQPLAGCDTRGLSEPMLAYKHDNVSSAIIGGYVYRGRALPPFEGAYVFGDWGRGDGRLFAAVPPGSGSGPWTMRRIEIRFPEGMSTLGQLLGLGRDSDGELYVLVRDPGAGPQGTSGRVFKLVPP